MLALRHLARRTAARFATTSTNSRTWKVYLSGEIHSDWREVIGDGVSARNLPVTIDAPNTSHEDSDDCGAIILGDEEKRPNYDNKGARLNLIRTRTLIDDADVVVVRFGDKYRQWNAAFDAGYATAKGKALVTLHPPGVSHMLKEVNATALAVLGSRIQASMGAGYAISSLVGGRLAQRDVRLAYLASCVLGCGVASLIALGLRETLPDARRTDTSHKPES